MKKLCFVFSIITLLFVSCGKDNPPTQEPSTNDTTLKQNKLPQPGIYIAGDSIDQASRKYPVYWINGKEVHLSDDIVNASGTGIAVSDSNVYVSCDGVGLGKNITYWRNTTAVSLPDTSVVFPTSTGVTLSGTDVYVIGQGYNNDLSKFTPIYWKNEDKPIKITTPFFYRGEGRAIAVSGGNIYIAGTTQDPSTGKLPPSYWKNGTPTFLYPVNPFSSGLAKSIFISGSDVYVVGDAYPVGTNSRIGWALYWKNGIATELGPADKISEANAVVVVGNDVYIAGAMAGADRVPHATYWKNGVPITLDTKYSVATGIAVSGNDVYVAGNRGVDSALYWKNGMPVILGAGRAYAITIKN